VSGRTAGARGFLPGVSGIVLAGGRSTRFGGDKLGAALDGRPVLDHTIGRLAAVAQDLVVVLAPGDRRRLEEPVDDRRIRIAYDREPGGGPLVGLVAGLEAVSEPIALIVGGDMPRLHPDVLRLLVGTLLEADEGIAAYALESRGRLEPLPVAVRTGAATDVASRLVTEGERSLRALFERLPTRLIDEAAWRPLDPEAATLHDVDVPADL
jgi:molybdopterin-guanine dinucleotide biosynthesis protein A